MSDQMLQVSCQACGRSHLFAITRQGQKTQCEVCHKHLVIQGQRTTTEMHDQLAGATHTMTARVPGKKDVGILLRRIHRAALKRISDARRWELKWVPIMAIGGAVVLAVVIVGVLAALH